MVVSRGVGPRSSSVAAEALGYVGGALVLVGAGLVVARSWETLGAAGRVGVLGGAGAVAALVAWRTPVLDEGVGAPARLKGTLWLVATLTLALAAGVGVHDVLDLTSPQAVVSSGGAVATAVAAAAWRGRPRPLQQATTWLGAAIAIGAAGGHLSSPGGSGAFAAVVGVAAVVTGLTGRSRPSFVAVWCGGLTLLVSCQMIGGQWQSAGLVTSVLVGSALVGLAVTSRPVVDRAHVIACAVSGGVLLATNLPAAIAYHAQQAGVATGIVVWVGAAGLLWWGSHPRWLRAPVPVWAGGAVLFVVGPTAAARELESPALVTGVVASVAVVGAGIALSSVPGTLVGTLGLLVFVPWSVARLFPGAVAAPLAIVLVGLVIVAVALWLLRRRQRSGEVRSSAA